MKHKLIACLLVCSALLFSGCSNQPKDGLQNGYYTAQASEFSHGWKEFVTLSVQDGKIISVEYNAKNPSGFIKSWDMDYMRTMNMIVGNYPNRYTRNYGSQLVETQDSQQIDALAGATSSHNSFTQLADAAIQQARTGDSAVAVVQIKE